MWTGREETLSCLPHGLNLFINQKYRTRNMADTAQNPCPPSPLRLGFGMWMVGEGEGEPVRAKQCCADKLNNLLQQGGGEEVDLWAL